jgi:dihydroorotase
MARRHKDLVVGIKIAHYAGPDWGPVEKAVKAGLLVNIPVIVDFATFRPERPFRDRMAERSETDSVCYRLTAPCIRT